MNYLAIAIALGVLEGLTEFIPVSSTGHLILMGDLLSFTGPKADSFNVFIQLGAILAVVALYPHRFLALFDFSRAHGDKPVGFRGMDGISKLVVTSIPALFFGALFHEAIKTRLFTPLPVAAALLLGGIIMVWIERRERTVLTTSVEELTLRQCFGIGLFQCLALWPGMSRSGSTIIGGMLLGLERKLAAEFSFLAAVPIMCAAVGYDLLKSRVFLEAADIPFFALGFLVSFVVAVAAIRFFVAIVSRYSLIPFGWYRIALGILVLVSFL